MKLTKKTILKFTQEGVFSFFTIFIRVNVCVSLNFFLLLLPVTTI